MNFNLGDTIYSTLDGEFEGKVKIYPIINTDENAKLPFIAYRRSGYLPEYTKDLYSLLDTYHYQISVVSDVYRKGIEIADRVINSLMALTGTAVDGKIIQSCEVVNADESATEDVLFVQTLDFDIRISK